MTTASAAKPEGKAWHSQSAKEVLAQLGSAATGLSAAEAAQRLVAKRLREWLRSGSERRFLLTLPLTLARKRRL